MNSQTSPALPGSREHIACYLVRRIFQLSSQQSPHAGKFSLSDQSLSSFLCPSIPSELVYICNTTPSCLRGHTWVCFSISPVGSILQLSACSRRASSTKTTSSLSLACHYCGRYVEQLPTPTLLLRTRLFFFRRNCFTNNRSFSFPSSRSLPFSCWLSSLCFEIDNDGDGATGSGGSKGRCYLLPNMLRRWLRVSCRCTVPAVSHFPTYQSHLRFRSFLFPIFPFRSWTFLGPSLPRLIKQFSLDIFLTSTSLLLTHSTS